MNHSAVKAGLFLLAGNFLATYRTKTIARVGGGIRRLPTTGLLWLAGLFAITGSPPFGTFASEFTMLKEAFAQGRTVVGIVALAALAVAFAGMSKAFLGMALGRPPEEVPAQREAAAAVWPALALLGVSLGLGLWIPQGLQAALEHAARLLGGGVP